MAKSKKWYAVFSGRRIKDASQRTRNQGYTRKDKRKNERDLLAAKAEAYRSIYDQEEKDNARAIRHMEATS